MSLCRRMKVLMVNFEFPPIGGGGGHAHSQLLRHYADNASITVDVLTVGTERGTNYEQFADNIGIHRIGIKKRNLHYWRKTEVIAWLLKARGLYRKLVSSNKYDLVHAFFGFPSGWLCYKNPSDLPYIVSLRGSDVPGYNPRLGLDYILLSGCFRKIWRNAAAVVANSKGLADLATAFTPDVHIDVIPNGVDMRLFAPANNRVLNSPVRLLTVCRLITRKRIDLLIDTIAEVKRQGIDLQLTIAGQGNLLERLRNHADSLGVLEQVIFLGRVPAEQMPQIYRNHDIFVMSSIHEGMSNAMLEALASGLPIITTQCEGVEELVSDNGIVVSRPESPLIAQAVMKLIGQKDIFANMCQAAVARATKYSWPTTAKSYLELYRNTIVATADGAAAKGGKAI